MKLAKGIMQLRLTILEPVRFVDGHIGPFDIPKHRFVFENDFKRCKKHIEFDAIRSGKVEFLFLDDITAR